MSLPFSDEIASTELAVPRVFGAGVQVEHLAAPPVTSFMVPGLILGVITGGAQLTARIALLVRDCLAPLLATAAGFGMLIWIFTELEVFGHSWLHATHVARGILELILALALIGTTPAFASPWNRNRGPGRSPSTRPQTRES